MGNLIPMEAGKKIHHGALIHTWKATSFFDRVYCAWRIFVGAIWMLRRGEIFAWTDDDYDSAHHENASLRRALCEYQLKHWTIQYKLSLFSIEGDA